MQSNQNSNHCPGLNAKDNRTTKNTKESFRSAIVDVSEAAQGPHEVSTPKWHQLWATGVKKRQSCIITAYTSLNASKADLQNFVHKALCLGEIQQALVTFNDPFINVSESDVQWFRQVQIPLEHMFITVAAIPLTRLQKGLSLSNNKGTSSAEWGTRGFRLSESKHANEIASYSVE